MPFCSYKNMSADTTSPTYWLNYRFFLCAAFIFLAMVVAGYLIFKFEGFNESRRRRREGAQKVSAGCVFEDESWKTCIKEVHPLWLLSYRLIAFGLLLSVLLTNVFMDGGGIFYFYTQWTFTLVTIYFGLGSLLSIRGCCFESSRNHVNQNDYRGTYVAPPLGDSEMPNTPKVSYSSEESSERRLAGAWSCIFQIIYQMSAGAVVLTDCVFWIILYPLYLATGDFHLKFLDVCLHSLNAIFLIGDTFLNSMRFPLFRFAYFVLWTGVYVIFQWIIHACISMWWPYPFLDLSSSTAPLWYLGVAVMHVPCYGLFALIIRLKRYWLSRCFPESYQS